LKYLIYNETDDVFASPDKMTLAEAQRFVEDFTKRYYKQGQNLTADGVRIDPEEVILLIKKA
jgi:hypothetical protein